MRNAGGYASIVGPDPTVEIDTFTCVHCNGVVFVRERADMGGFCRQCMRHICGSCADSGECTPFLKAIEKSEEAGAKRRQLEKALGL